MKLNKLNHLLAAARRDHPAVPPENFVEEVLRAVRREPRSARTRSSWLEALNDWFPRLAWGAALFIALCVASDYGLSALSVPTVGDGIHELSQQWLFTLTGE